MPLITTTDEIKRYLAIDANTSINTLTPFINEAELLYIKPLLGSAFYDTLVADYDTDLEYMSADNQEIMPFIQATLCYYMSYLAIEQLGVNVGDMGIQQQFGENSQPAPRWKVEQLQLSYIQKADLHAEKMLEYLENNATALKFNDWFSDAALNTKMEGWLVYSTIVASRYIDINDSRRIFLRLKKRIKDIESNYIKRLICNDQYAELVTQIQTGTITAANQALIDKIRPIVAKKALYLTIPSLRISITDQGITIFSSNDSVVSKATADRDQIKYLMHSLKEDEFGYKAYEQELQKFIADNIADYPLIAASECYTIAPDPGPSWTVENSSLNKHFSV